MSIAPALAGDTIYQGAAHLVIDKGATPLVPATWKYLFCDGAVTVRLVRPADELAVAGYGRVAELLKDETVEVIFTPAQQKIDAAILSFLWGDILSKMIGASWFGSTNHPLYVHTMAGRILEIANCRPTTFVPLLFGDPAKRYGGSVTCTGVLKRGVARSAAGALYTDWADQAWHTAPDEDDFQGFACSAAWTLTEALAIEGMEAWQLTPQVNLTPVAPPNIGTIDFRVSDLSLEISGAPANFAEANLWATYANGLSRALGTSVRPGGDFTIAEDAGGLTAVVKNAVWRDPKTRFDASAPIADKCVWRSRRKAVTVEGVTTWTPAGTCAITPA